MFFNHLPSGLVTDLPVVASQALSLPTLLLAFLVSLIPVSVAIFGLIALKDLFSLYEKAIFFTAENVKCFRRLGTSLISWVVANLIFVTAISAVISFNNAPGERVIVAQFGVTDIAMLLIGFVVVLVSWVMDEAVKLEDEHAYTV
jgi:hypothetical protein